VQNEYSLLKRDPEHGVLAHCTTRGLGFLPYFPLASGLLSGKYSPGAAPVPSSARLADASAPLATRFRSESNTAVAEALGRFAQSRGHSLLELAFSWLLAQPAVSTVIAGATSAEQIEANAKAARWQLSADDLTEVDRIAPRAPLS
jgi:aryl-alcohol dehydrogenase-like predicted oxidoreductase